ncbi:hypothetical protein [Micromonospora rifamycinica]|uniref:Uncharacterized protein n=1 Tax=Micromonospora rifamycinica TaxID=291594 RepID=A0A1C5IJT0_9ACTN|nr:hypothetical protein [Micromonospora rifamycinica]SCG58628.1 hypothetical protein GA0070623_2631 [Micromonospora rifamycinica]
MFKLIQRKRSDDRSNFIDDVLRGKATLDQIDDYIDRWHDAPDGSPAASVELHEFLGMTWEEYRLWGERPESLRFTVAARRANKPVSDILRSDRALGAAARSSSKTDAELVLTWLKSRGRIGKIAD